MADRYKSPDAACGNHWPVQPLVAETAVYDIFLSYSSRDRKRVAQLVDALTEQRGWSIWWDEHLQTGSRYTGEIEQTLAQSRCVLVVWSENSVESDWVRSEADQGRRRGILAPIRLDASEPPMPFGQTETTDFSCWKGSAHAPELLQLIEAVQRILAVGSAPGTEELLRREKRQAAIRRQRRLRVAAIAGGIFVAVVAALFGYLAYADRQQAVNAADYLAQESGKFLEAAQARETEKDRKAGWWHLLFDRPTYERLDNISLSLLLGMEAVRLEPTDDARRALRNALAISPFSDWGFYKEARWADGRSVVFSHDAKLLAIGGSSNGTLVWDFRNDEVVARLPHGATPREGWTDKFGVKRYSRGYSVIDFSPVDYRLATSELDGSIKLWDASNGNELWSGQHDEPVVAVRFSPDGAMLASASYDGTARLWDVDMGRELARIAHDNIVTWVEFSEAGDLLVTACRDGSARIWNAADGAKLAEVSVGEELEGARFNPAGDLLLVFGDDIKTGLWDWRGQKRVWELPVSSNRDAGGIFSADGKRLVVGDAQGQVSWWDVEKMEPLFSKQAGAFVISMRASDDRHRIVTVDTVDLVQVWDLESGRELKRMPYARWVKSGALSRDGELLASGGEEYTPDYTEITEVTRVWPEDPLEAGCRKVKTRGNLTRNEWQRYFPDQPYRLTCPEHDEPENF